jgi:hypothetical protein
MSLPSPFPERFLVEPMVAQEPGPSFGPRSSYVETAWLVILGPVSMLLFRKLGTLLECRPDGFMTTVSKLEEELGLGPSTDLPSPVIGAINRLVIFDAADWAYDCLGVRMGLPALAPNMLRCLTPELAEVEERLRLVEAEPL